MLSVFSYGQLVLPKRKRAVYTTLAVSNEADTIGPVVFSPWRESWAMPFGLKKELFGSNRREVGGQTEAEEVEEDGEMEEQEDDEEGIPDDVLPGVSELRVSQGVGSKSTRSDSNVEVVFMHAWPEDLYVEILNSFALKALIDLTAGPGCAAMACIKERKPYLGCCMTDKHAAWLEQRIVMQIFDGMLAEDSKLHCLELTKLVAANTAAKRTSGENPAPAPKRGRTNPKGGKDNNDNPDKGGKDKDKKDKPKGDKGKDDDDATDSDGSE